MKKEITLKALMENLPRAAAFVRENLEFLQLPVETITQINVAVEEIFVNIASYAYYPGIGPVSIELEVKYDTPEVVIIFTDNGIPYDPLQKEDPDVDHTGKELQVGGLGIFLVKNNVDDVIYNYKEGKNILMIRKYV